VCPVKRVGIVTAIAREVTFVIDRLEPKNRDERNHRTLFSGDFEGKQVSIIISGIGKRRAREATDALISKAMPDIVISAGFSGALTRGLSVGDIVIPKLVTLDGEDRSHRVARLPGITTNETGYEKILTARRFIAHPEEKEALFNRSGAVAVDMESFFVAEACAARQTLFFAIRAISDGATAIIPPPQAIVDNAANLMRKEAARYCVKNPHMILPTIMFMVNLTIASRALGRSLLSILRLL